MFAESQAVGVHVASAKPPKNLHNAAEVDDWFLLSDYTRKRVVGDVRFERSFLHGIHGPPHRPYGLDITSALAHDEVIYPDTSVCTDDDSTKRRVLASGRTEGDALDRHGMLSGSNLRLMLPEPGIYAIEYNANTFFLTHVRGPASVGFRGYSWS